VVPVPAVSSIIQQRVVSGTTLHYRGSTLGSTTNDPMRFPEGSIPPPMRSSRSQSSLHSTLSQAVHATSYC